VSEDNGPPRGPQLPHFQFPSPEQRDKSPLRRALLDLSRSLAQYTLERRERGRLWPRRPSDVIELGRQWHAWWRRQKEQAREQPPEPDEPQPEQPIRPSDKRGRGQPRIEWSYLSAALEALGKKWPKMRSSQTTKRHIEFVRDFCRDRGDEIERIYDDDGKVLDEALEKALRRRIDEWKHRPARTEF